MEIGTKFFDNRDGGGEFEITHITGNQLTILITRKPKEGVLTVANPALKLSVNEFVMSKKSYRDHSAVKNIIIEEWS